MDTTPTKTLRELAIEFVTMEDEYHEATKPSSGWSKPKTLPPGNTILVAYIKARSAFRAALETPEPGWLPIDHPDTPKATALYLWSKDDGMMVGLYYDGAWGYFAPHDDSWHFLYPSHWRPMHQPPEE